MIDLHPTECNLCGGEVLYQSNRYVYGKEYGSGMCYYCLRCGAYVGTHIPRPREALGILANREMRDMKMKCHNLFDSMWSSRRERSDLYIKLAKEMSISEDDCHFGYFDLEMLSKAYMILKRWKRC